MNSDIDSPYPLNYNSLKIGLTKNTFLILKIRNLRYWPLIPDTCLFPMLRYLNQNKNLDNFLIEQGYDDIPKEIQDADAKKVVFLDFLCLVIACVQGL